MFLWFFLNFKKNKLNFGLGEEIYSVKEDLENSFKGVSIKNIIGNKIDELKNKTIGELQKEEEIKKKAIEEVINRINFATSTINSVSYQHEPWKIEFSYDSIMKKNYDSKKQEIYLYYEDNKDTNLSISKQELVKQTFNDWLNKNHDLQKLNKEEIDGFIFWWQEILDETLKIKEYYLNIDKDLYILNAQSPKMEENRYFENLISVIKSLKTY